MTPHALVPMHRIRPPPSLGLGRSVQWPRRLPWLVPSPGPRASSAKLVCPVPKPECQAYAKSHSSHSRSEALRLGLWLSIAAVTGPRCRDACGPAMSCRRREQCCHDSEVHSRADPGPPALQVRVARKPGPRFDTRIPSQARAHCPAGAAATAMSESVRPWRWAQLPQPAMN